MNVRCPTCHRRETWSGPDDTVQQPGGSRRPSEHPEIVAWKILKRSRAGELGPMVGPCPVCGLPMVGDPGAPTPSLAWTLNLPDGPVRVEHDALHGAPDEAALEARLEKAYGWKLEIKPGAFLFQTFVISASAIPIFLLWVWACVFTFYFITNVFAH